MSGPVLLYLPDDLLARIDKRVAVNKEVVTRRKLKRSELTKAKWILKNKGAGAAEKFVESLNRTDKRKHSRVRLIAELLETGLKHHKK